MKKLIYVILVLSIILIIQGVAHAGSSPKVDLKLEKFIPEKLQQGVPFEMIFRFENTGNEPVTPSAEVTIFGDIHDSDRNPVFRITDKTYRVYNFFPGDRTARQRLYIGSLRSGTYTIRLEITTYNKIKSTVVSQVKLDIPINVE